jgi:hypothetical protein
MSGTRRVLSLAGLGVFAITLSISGVASAAPVVKEYPLQPNARNFEFSSGGWAPEVQIDGVCVPGLTCPMVRAQYESTGGAGGNGGYLRTEINPPTLAAALTVSHVIFRSPPFRFDGVRGKDPDRLTFRITRRADVDKFLSLLNDEAEFAVHIIDVGQGTPNAGITVVPFQTLAGAPEWSNAAPVNLEPDDLTIGRRYRIEIITRYVTDAVVIPMASADYDNVRLRAVFNPDANRRQIRVPELRRLLRQGPPKSASLKNGRLTTRVRCPAKAPQGCKVAATGLVRKGGRPVTNTQTRRIRAGGGKAVRLKVKDGALDGKKFAIIRLRVQSGNSNATVFKRVRIRR